MIWVVTWIVVSTFMVPCPVNYPKPDKFGVTMPSNATYANICWESTEKMMIQEFATEEEAVAFIEEGKKRYTGFTDCNLKDFKLEKKTEVQLKR